MHTKQAKPETAKAVLAFFDWSFKHGQKIADQLDYVSMPDNVVSMVEDMWSEEIKSSGGKPVWSASN
jgi:phosphate transport system substrate-binding protein